MRPVHGIVEVSILWLPFCVVSYHFRLVHALGQLQMRHLGNNELQRVLKVCGNLDAIDDPNSLEKRSDLSGPCDQVLDLIRKKEASVR